MDRHTEGPWSADPNDLLNGDEIAVRSDASPDAVVAVVWPWGDDEVGISEREANARLIAAAPEMLALLREMEAAYGDYAPGQPFEFPEGHLHNRVRDVIRRIEAPGPALEVKG